MVYALAGNRTRAARVAGEHSTTEPPVLILCHKLFLKFILSILFQFKGKLILKCILVHA